MIPIASAEPAVFVVRFNELVGAEILREKREVEDNQTIMPLRTDSKVKVGTVICPLLSKEMCELTLMGLFLQKRGIYDSNYLRWSGFFCVRVFSGRVLVSGVSLNNISPRSRFFAKPCSIDVHSIVTHRTSDSEPFIGRVSLFSCTSEVSSH